MTRKVTIGRLPFGFSAAPASGSSAGNSTISVRLPVIFMASPGTGLGNVGCRLTDVAAGRNRRAQIRYALTISGRSGIAGSGASPDAKPSRRPGAAGMTRDAAVSLDLPPPAVAVPASDPLNTFPKLLLTHARRRPDRPAMREKDYGIWQSWSWAEIAAEVEALAGALKTLGFERGDKLAIIGDNRPRLYWAIAAAQALGGVPVPVYQDSIAEEMAFVLDHAEVRFAIVEDQEQVDKLVLVKERCPLLEGVIYSDPRGLRHYPQPYLHAYDRMRETGQAALREH